MLKNKYVWQIILLQEDYRALERLTKSKEAALLEAEKSVQVAQAKVDMVDDLQNKNQELTRQLEISQVTLYRFFLCFGLVK